MDEFIILSQQDLRAAMRFGDYLEAVADGFRLLAEGRCASPVPTQIDVAHGAAVAARKICVCLKVQIYAHVGGWIKRRSSCEPSPRSSSYCSVFAASPRCKPNNRTVASNVASNNKPAQKTILQRHARPNTISA